MDGGKALFGPSVIDVRAASDRSEPQRGPSASSDAGPTIDPSEAVTAGPSPAAAPSPRRDRASNVVGRVCDLVLPCRNEAAALADVFASIPSGFGVVVVDNGSTDGTGDVARALGARVVLEPTPGYGAAVHAGVRAAVAPYIAVMDADGSMDGADLLPLLAAVSSGEADLAMGIRRPTAGGVWPWHARLGNRLVLAHARQRFGVDVRDIPAMRVCRREGLLGLGVRDRRFGYPLELLIRAHRAGWIIAELDVGYGPRAPGTRSKVSGSVRGSLRAARDFGTVLR